MKAGFKFLRISLARLVAAGLAGAALGASGSASAIVADPAGASAFGNVSGDFLIGCTTCSHIPLTMTGTPSQSSGGPGFVAAEVGYAGTPLGNSPPELSDYTVGGSATFAALANFSGLSYTPVLKARATAENVPAYIITQPQVQVGVDTFQAFAQAQGIQRYTFIGANATTYTFNFRVDGSVKTSQASVSASASFHDASDPFLEVSLASGGVFREGVGLAQTTSIDESFSVAVTFQAGMSYYLKSALSAGTAYDYASTSVSADAYNTFLVTSITGGDTNLLVAGIAPVPEPQVYAMLTLGLVIVGAARRRSAGARVA